MVGILPHEKKTLDWLVGLRLYDRRFVLFHLLADLAMGSLSITLETSTNRTKKRERLLAYASNQRPDSFLMNIWVRPQR